MAHPIAAPFRVTDPAEAALARVLLAEREAREAIEHAKVDAQHMAGAARSDARTVAERTERRIRRVVACFERDLARQLAELEAEAAAIAQLHHLGDDERTALARAVAALARELTGDTP